MPDCENVQRWINFMNLQSTAITEERYKELVTKTPKRKRFCDEHGEVIRTSQKPDDDGLYLNFSFKETIEPIITKTFSAHFFPNKFGYGARIENGKRDELESFIAKFNQTVFIRSLLPCMIALNMNFKSGSDEYTVLGSHEHQAKENNIRESIDFITNEVTNTIMGFPFYQHADGIACVPPSTGKDTCLPKIIGTRVAEALGIENFTDKLRFIKKNKSLQNETASEKWSTLAASQLTTIGAPGPALMGKVVILLDDLYQSGSTMHYTAMKLQQAGAAHVLGLAIVKSRRDDDNFEKK